MSNCVNNESLMVADLVSESNDNRNDIKLRFYIKSKMRRIFLASAAGLASFKTIQTWDRSRRPVKCDDSKTPKNQDLTLFHKTPTDAQTVLKSLNPKDASKRRQYWVEPKCGVPFPELIETIKWNGSREINEELSFLCGGLRCMLGDSALCDLQPHTRVYAYGLYIPPTEYPTDETFSDAILKMNKYKGTRMIRMIAIIPKDGIHWARGFFKSISRHARVKDYDYDKKRTKRAHKEVVKFCELFAKLGDVPAGTEFHLTWSESGLILLMDGNNIGTIRNSDAIGSIFKVFFNVANNSLQKPVNEYVATQAEKMWNLRQKSPSALFHQPPVECPIFDVGRQPDSDPCFLRGNQFTLLSSGGFDVVRSRWARKPCDEEKKKHTGPYNRSKDDW